jgi:hypothetical protein
MLFLIQTLALSGEHRVFVAEEFIQKGRFTDNTAQSKNKIPGIDLIIILGNFTNGPSTAPMLLRGVPFFSLACGVRTFL